MKGQWIFHRPFFYCPKNPRKSVFWDIDIAIIRTEHTFGKDIKMTYRERIIEIIDHLDEDTLSFFYGFITGWLGLRQ